MQAPSRHLPRHALHGCVRAHTEIMSGDRKDANRFLVKQAVTVEIEGEDTPAVYAEWLGMSIIG